MANERALALLSPLLSSPPRLFLFFSVPRLHTAPPAPQPPQQRLELALTPTPALLRLPQHNPLPNPSSSQTRSTLANMSTTEEDSACWVCGKASTSRCSACGSAGFVIAFCSREHQKLVRFPPPPFLRVYASLSTTFEQIWKTAQASLRRRVEFVHFSGVDA